jgi:hypothetical protein
MSYAKSPSDSAGSLEPINISDNKVIDFDDNEYVVKTFENKRFTKSDIEEVNIVKDIFGLKPDIPFDVQSGNVFFAIPDICDFNKFTLKDAVELFYKEVFNVDKTNPIIKETFPLLSCDLDKILFLKYYNRLTTIPYNISNYFTFKMTIRRKNQTIIFATLYGYNEYFKSYSRDIPIANQLDFAFFKDQKIDIKYDWACLGKPFDSKDGEYRDIMSNIATISKNMSVNILAQKLINEIVDYIKEKIQNDDLVTAYDIIVPIQGMEVYSDAILISIFREPFKQFVKDSNGTFQISIYDFCIAYYWLNMVYTEYFGLTLENVNKKYRNVFYSKPENDLHFFNYLVKEYSMEYINYVLIIIGYAGYNLTNTTLRPSSYTYLFHSLQSRFGQKLIQVTIDNVVNIPDMNKNGKLSEPKETNINAEMKNWAELIVGKHINERSNITFNSTTISWFFIKNKRLNIFENEGQITKAGKSELYKRILNNVKEALNTYMQGKVNIKNMKEELITIYQKLLRKISSSNIMNMINSYDGFTLYDYKKILQSNKFYARKRNIFENEKMFNTFLFMLFFSNMKLSEFVFHKDLHLNNIIIQFINLFNDETKEIYIKTSLYNEVNIYIKYAGFFPKIIDYSRIIAVEKITIQKIFEYICSFTGIEISYQPKKNVEINNTYKKALIYFTNYFDNLNKIDIYFGDVITDNNKKIFDKHKVNIKKILLSLVNSILTEDIIKIKTVKDDLNNFIFKEFKNVIMEEKSIYKKNNNFILHDLYYLNSSVVKNIIKYSETHSEYNNINVDNYEILKYISERVYAKIHPV